MSGLAASTASTNRVIRCLHRRRPRATRSAVHHRRRPAARGQRLDRFLADAIGTLSRSRVKALIEQGTRSGDGRVLDATGASRCGPAPPTSSTLPAPMPATPQPQAIPFPILYEDADLIVLDKPAGLVVHPAPGNQDGTLVNALLAHCGEQLTGIGAERRPGIVHRLDKDTSGVMVVAKTQLANAAPDRRLRRPRPRPRLPGAGAGACRIRSLARSKAPSAATSATASAWRWSPMAASRR